MAIVTGSTLLGSETPLQALQASHVRIEKRLALLVELCHHVHRHGSDEAAGITARVVMRYFDDAESSHRADEEVDLFPALAAAAEPATRNAVSRLLERLVAQHEDIEHCYLALRPHLALLAQGEKAELPESLCQRLYEQYMQHIATEDSELLPLAARSLSQEALRRLELAMAVRRAIDSFSG